MNHYDYEKVNTLQAKYFPPTHTLGDRIQIKDLRTGGREMFPRGYSKDYFNRVCEIINESLGFDILSMSHTSRLNKNKRDRIILVTIPNHMGIE